MSWVSGHEVFNNTKNWKNEAYEIADDAVVENYDHGYGFEFHAQNKIKPLSHKVFIGEKQAKDFVFDNSEQWWRKYNPYVGFIDKKNEKLNKLENSLEKAKASREKIEVDARNAIVQRKSKTITCKNCGSSLNIYFMMRNHMDEIEKCPLCGADLRSKTVLDRLNKWDERIKKVKTDIAEEENRLAENSKPNKIFFAFEEYVG